MRILFAALFIIAPSFAHASCFVDYKARKDDDSLKLHYGVMAMSGSECLDMSLAQKSAQERLNASGWTLLRIVSKFDESKLGEKETDAGPFFLKF